MTSLLTSCAIGIVLTLPTRAAVADKRPPSKINSRIEPRPTKGPAPVPATAPAAHVATILSPFKIGPARDVVTMTFTGPTPKWTLRRVDPDHVHLTLDARLRQGYQLERTQTGSPFLRVMAVELPHGKSRLSFKTMRGMRVVASKIGNTIRITFDKRSLLDFWHIYRQSIFRVGRPVLWADGTLVLPVLSPLEPSVRVVTETPDLAWVEVPFDGSIPARLRIPTYRQTFATGPYTDIRLAKERWGTVRLSMGLRDRRSFETRVVRMPQGWQIQIRRRATPFDLPEGPLPSTSPSPRPDPTPTPAPSPEPTPVPCPCGTPSILPTPCPSPTPEVHVEDPDWDPLSRLMLGLGRTGMTESYPEGGVVDVAVNDITTLALHARHAMGPTWSLEGDLRVFERYTIIDRLLASSTHARTDLALQGAALWDLQQGPFRESLGLGYGFRYLTAEHSLTPIAKDFLFSDLQLFQGPFIRADLSIRPWRPVRAYLRTHLQPATLVLVDPLVDGVPDVRRAAAEIGLEYMKDQYVLRIWQVWDHSWRGSLPFQQLTGTGVSAGLRY